jgi:hypothetical protein
MLFFINDINKVPSLYDNNFLKPSPIKINSAIAKQFESKELLVKCGYEDAVNSHIYVIFHAFTESFPVNQFSPNFFLILYMSF